MSKKLPFYPDNIPLDRNDIFDILKPLSGGRQSFGRDSDILQTILTKVRATKYNHLHYNDTSEALHSVFTNEDLLIHFFCHPATLHHLTAIYRGYMRQQNEKMNKKRAEKANNGIKHEDYDAAVDVVEEFIEIGLDTLDEEQLEIYEENLEIVKTYEGS